MMNRRCWNAGPWARLRMATLAVGVTLSSCAREAPKSPKAEPPAKVQNAVKEADLATITLTAEAESRLGIQTEAVEMRKVGRTRMFGGEVVIPPEAQVQVSAPVAGRLAAPPEGAVPAVGAAVKGGQALFRLSAIPAERDLLRAREEASQAGIRREFAAKKAARAAQMLRDKAGSARAHEEAQGELAMAEAASQAAQDRLDRLLGGRLEEMDSWTPLAVEAPLEGVVREVFARAGQTVPAGAPLLDIFNLETVWIRVPVYVGEMSSIAAGRPARVHGPGDGRDAPGRPAKPVAAPPSADPNASTVDLYYELSNAGRALRPAQKVWVTLELGESEQALVVPWSATLHDALGGTWVYVASQPRTYVRRRVDIRYVAGDLAVLSKGPAPGTQVITAGAAELFGTEFATGK